MRVNDRLEKAACLHNYILHAYALGHVSMKKLHLNFAVHALSTQLIQNNVINEKIKELFHMKSTHSKTPHTLRFRENI